MKKLLLVGLLFGTYFQNNIAANNNNSDKKNKDKKVFVAPENLTENDYVANTVLFKVKPEFRTACSRYAINDQDILNAMNELVIGNVKKMFPFAQAPTARFNAQGKAYADITLVYELKYVGNMSVVDAVNKLLATGKLEYAEPKYTYKTTLTPNDPSLSQQNNYLTRINAFNGWNTSTGDTNVVIGIVDSGTDIDHPDLVENLKINYNEPVNGVDDDLDGYIDNYRGWDISDNDNNANVDNSTHGSHVSGCAAAASDNGIGVASSGFHCKFLPVKCAAQASTTSIDNGYEGITYAADHGCSIINCSWGGSFGGSTGQDVITYATINKNALVVCAAGNDNVDQLFFPASFKYALSVAATNNNNDTKASFSNYNYMVDVCAPGVNIYATVDNDSYTSMSGTSMASPVAAGAAAIVKSVFPSYNALQVGEQLRVTCDNIYALSGNASYKGRLGNGRINMANSLTQSKPSVRMDPINIVDGNDNAFVANDTLQISGDFMNYLAPTTNCTVTLAAQTGANYVTFINPTYTIGALGTLATTNNNAAPFKVVIKPNTPTNTKILFRLTYADGTTYTDIQCFDVYVNVDYINVTVNLVNTSITSKGRLFYNADGQTQGLGFVYKDSSMVYEGGLMIGTSTTQLVNNIRAAAGTPDNDFKSIDVVKINSSAPHSDFDTYGTFNDGNATATQVGVTVKHRSWAWVATTEQKYVMVEYKIINTSGATLNNLYAGIFADWDIQNYSTNKSDVDNALKLGYAYCSTSTQMYAGVKVLSHTPFNMYAADNVTGGGGGLDFSAGITTAQKYQALSTSRPQAGTTGAGNDVINIVSTGPFTVNANDTIVVAFALLGGDNLADMQASAASAQIKYDAVSVFPDPVSPANGITRIDNNASLFRNFPNPTNGSTTFTFALPQASNIDLSIYDVTGKLVSKLVNGQYAAGSYTLDANLSELSSGVYTYVLKTNSSTQTNKLTIIK